MLFGSRCRRGSYWSSHWWIDNTKRVITAIARVHSWRRFRWFEITRAACYWDSSGWDSGWDNTGCCCWCWCGGCSWRCCCGRAAVLSRLLWGSCHDAWVVLLVEIHVELWRMVDGRGCDTYGCRRCIVTLLLRCVLLLLLLLLNVGCSGATCLVIIRVTFKLKLVGISFGM